jgi:predicted HTH domain antitoxin
MFEYHQPVNKMAQDCAMYDLLANYYKYLDPQKHIHYYQLHFMCMQQLCQVQDFSMRYPTQNQAPAKVRVLHISPDTPRVDIYINDKKTLENMTYYQISPYLDLPAGSYQIDVYPVGQKSDRILRQSVDVKSGESYTIAAAGQFKELRLIPVVDTTEMPKDKAKVRVWHLSPNTPAVDIAVEDNDVLFSNVSFGNAAEYLELAPGKVTLELREAGTENVLLTIRDTPLKANEAYTIAAIGMLEGKPRLEALILKP